MARGICGVARRGFCGVARRGFCGVARLVLALLRYCVARLAGWVFAAICGGPAGRLGFAVSGRVLGKKLSWCVGTQNEKAHGPHYYEQQDNSQHTHRGLCLSAPTTRPPRAHHAPTTRQLRADMHKAVCIDEEDTVGPGPLGFECAE